VPGSSVDLGGECMRTLPWYYATRTLGVVMVLYGLFGDKTPERGTIIITGAGLIGVDKVARSEKNDDRG
jgi:hypothetical protein